MRIEIDRFVLNFNFFVVYRLFIIFLAVIGVSGICRAADALWLKISACDGADTFLQAEGLELTVRDGMLVCAGKFDVVSLPLDGLKSMEFTGESAGISGLDGDGADGPVAVFTVSGVLIDAYATVREAREALAGHGGVYLLKTKSQTFKISIK